MDDYSTDLNVDDDLCEDDEFWYGEDKVKLGDIPEALWLDAPTDVILQTIAHCHVSFCACHPCHEYSEQLFVLLLKALSTAKSLCHAVE